ncbi:hypothetical protein SFUMM280S_08234 [Streptomyces fumanus]
MKVSSPAAWATAASSRRVTRAIALSWCSPSRFCSAFMDLTRDFAGLPRAGPATSAAYRVRLAFLRASCSATSRSVPGAVSRARVTRAETLRTSLRSASASTFAGFLPAASRSGGSASSASRPSSRAR